jgi:cytochrome P450/NADPH-cytochrome P450 reductase
MGPDYDFVFAVLAARKANPIHKNDLLDKMLNGRDPKTGQGLPDDNIVSNVGIFSPDPIAR